MYKLTKDKKKLFSKILLVSNPQPKYLVLKGFHMSWAQTTKFSHEDRYVLFKCYMRL